MFRLKSIAFLAFVFCILPTLFISVEAQSTPMRTVFKTEQFVRTGGRDLYTRTFRVPSYVTSPFTVRVVDGNADGTARILSASVLIDGIMILGPTDFATGLATLEKTITLSAQSYHRLAVDLGGISLPGSFATVTVLGLAPTSLRGRILDTSAQPLPGVRLRIGSSTAITDTMGNFYLQGLAPGRQILESFGSAIGPYPDVRQSVYLQSAAENNLSHTIYLPRLDVENAVLIDPTRDTTVSTPLLPDVTLTIFAGSAQNPDGTPFTGRLSITRFSSDQGPEHPPSPLVV